MELLFLLNIAILVLIYYDNRKTKSEIMATLQDFETAINSIKESTANIAADLERIATEIAGGLKKSEADKVVADLNAAADGLRAVADINPEPVEPEPEPPVEPSEQPETPSEDDEV